MSISFDLSKIIFLAHLSATWMMLGIIWFVQLVHFPLFSSVGHQSFKEFQRKLLTSSIFVIGLPMCIEVGTGVLLYWYRLPGISTIQIWFGLILLAIIWACSLFIYVPQHLKLLKGFNQKVFDKLILFNWVRTIAWTLRGALMIWIINTIIYK